MQPGPYAAPPPAGRLEPLKPSGWWYVVGAVAGVVGIGLAIALGVVTFTRFVDRIDDFARIDAPGTDTVTLEAGEYTVFLEYPGATDDFSRTPAVDFTITDPDGVPVELDTYFGSSTYSADSREGEALYTFTADEPGDYTVRSEGEIATVAIGEGLFGGLFAGIAGAAASAIIGIIAALVIIITTAVKRSTSRTRRHLALTQPAYPPTPGYPPPPGYPPTSPGYTPPPTDPPTWPGSPGAPGAPGTPSGPTYPSTPPS